jgi:dienelactone hydrolase
MSLEQHRRGDKLMRTTSWGPLRLLATLAAVLGVLVLPTGASAQEEGFPSVGTAFDRPGPYPTTITRESAHTYYHPTTMGNGGLTHPVIIWGNGTFNSPSTYDAYFRRLASHGFIVAAANTSNSGTGREMIAGLDNLTRMHNQSGNRFSGKVDLERVAASGYSQGGGGALNAAKDPRVVTTIAIQPWQASVRGETEPVLLLSGSSDAVVSPRSVETLFNAAQAPAVYANLRGGTHFEVLGSGGRFRYPSTAWARWYLMGDTDARDVFVGSGCVLCVSSDWTPFRANARFSADPEVPAPVVPPPTTEPPTTEPPSPPTTEPPATTPPTTAPPWAPPTPRCDWWEWWCRR